MNIFNSIVIDEAQLQIQQGCDELISKLPCKDIVVQYFCASREHARQQKKEVKESSLLSLVSTIEKINKENDVILDELKFITSCSNHFEICKQLHSSKLLNYLQKRVEIE